MEEITRLLDEAIISQFSELTSMQVGSEEQSKGVKNLETLINIKLDMDKQFIDWKNDNNKCEIEKEKMEFDKQFKIKESKIKIVENGLKIILEGAGIVLPLMFYHAWMNRGFEFEEKGIISSMTFRDLIKNFKPKIK